MSTTTPRICSRLWPLLALLLTLLAAAEASACPDCPANQATRAEVMANDPLGTLGILTLAFALVAGAIGLSARFVRRARTLFAGALLMGAGLGALLDGIVLHQVLQWHALLSNVIEPIDLISSKVNMFWDGVFHIYAWLTTSLGIALVVRDVPSAAPEVRASAIVGGALGGFGLFNAVEGLIDHQLLELHHVHPGPHEVAWDIGFFAFGIALIVVGFVLAVPVLRVHDAETIVRPVLEGARPVPKAPSP